MNRTDLQKLAAERVRDAEALLAAGRWSAAYYLAGYAVECGLKACIAKKTNLHDFPDKEFLLKCYTHRSDVLAVASGLEADLKVRLAGSRTFHDNWQILKDWNEAARYRSWDEFDAREIFTAVTDPAEGILPWITAHW